MISLDKATIRAFEREARQLEALREETMATPSEEGLSDLIHLGGWTVFFYYFAIEDFKAAGSIAHQITSDVKYALFGQWRIGYVGWDDEEFKDVVWDKALARKHFNWFDPFRIGLTAAAVVGDWVSGKEIASYTDGPELPSWSADIEPIWTADSAAYYAELSKLIRHGGFDWEREPQNRSRRPAERVTLLRKCLTAINERDAGAAEHALAEYMRYYMTIERDRYAPTDLISIDGTLLYHLIHHLLKVEPHLQPHYLAMVPRLPEAS